MANKIWQDSWPDRNRQRNYPLAEDVTCLDNTGAFRIPEDFILGLRLPIDSGMIPDPGRFFLQTIAAFSTGYQITLGYHSIAGDIFSVAVAQISAENFEPNTVVLLTGQGDFAESIGHLMIGRLDSIARQPVGQFSFSLSTARLEPDCITPDIQGISAFRVRNRGVLSRRITADIEIAAGRNSRITVADGNKIVIDFIDGEGSVAACECEEAPGVPITHINGVGSGSNGDIGLAASNCLGVSSPGAGQLALSNSCAEPCCGCPELEAMAQKQSTYPSALESLKGFILRLDALGTSIQQTQQMSRLTRFCDP
jgi:hypothetical protein